MESTRIQEGSATTKFSVQLFRALCEGVNQTKSSHRLLSVVERSAHSFSGWKNAGIQATKLRPNVRGGNLVQKGWGGNRKPVAEHSKSQVQQSMYVKKFTMECRLSRPRYALRRQTSRRRGHGRRSGRGGGGIIPLRPRQTPLSLEQALVAATTSWRQAY